jgi:hypothetical protein
LKVKDWKFLKLPHSWKPQFQNVSIVIENVE